MSVSNNRPMLNDLRKRIGLAWVALRNGADPRRHLNPIALQKYLVRAYLTGASRAYDVYRYLPPTEQAYGKREFLRGIHCPPTDLTATVDGVVSALVQGRDSPPTKQEVLSICQPLRQYILTEQRRLMRQGYEDGCSKLGVVMPKVKRAITDIRIIDNKMQEYDRFSRTWNEFNPSQPRDELGRWSDVNSRYRDAEKKYKEVSDREFDEAMKAGDPTLMRQNYRFDALATALKMDSPPNISTSPVHEDVVYRAVTSDKAVEGYASDDYRSGIGKFGTGHYFATTRDEASRYGDRMMEVSISPDARRIDYEALKALPIPDDLPDAIKDQVKGDLSAKAAYLGYQVVENRPLKEVVIIDRSATTVYRPTTTNEFNPQQPRDELGRWSDTDTHGTVTRHQGIDNTTRRLFNRSVTDRELAAIGFSPEGTTATVNGDGSSLFINTTTEKKVLDPDEGLYIPELSCSRKITKGWFSPLTCYNATIKIPKNGSYGGKGFDLFYNQVQALRKLGVKRIVATAAGEASDPKSGAGYYVWPRYGYSGIMDSRQIARLPDEIKVALKGKRDIRDLFDIPGGKEAWQKVGSSIKVHFDLSDGSRNMRALEAYRNERTTRPTANIEEGGEFESDEQRRAFFAKLKSGEIKGTKSTRPVKSDTPTSEVHKGSTTSAKETKMKWETSDWVWAKKIQREKQLRPSTIVQMIKEVLQARESRLPGARASDHDEEVAALKEAKEYFSNKVKIAGVNAPAPRTMDDIREERQSKARAAYLRSKKR